MKHANGNGKGGAHANGNGRLSAVAQRLEALGVDTHGGREDGCWHFKGKLQGGAVRLSSVSGPPAVYLLAFGILPTGRKVFRVCGHNDCCAPHHLVTRKPRERFLAGPNALWRLRREARAGVPLHRLAVTRGLTLATVQWLVERNA